MSCMMAPTSLQRRSRRSTSGTSFCSSKAGNLKSLSRKCYIFRCKYHVKCGVQWRLSFKLEGAAVLLLTEKAGAHGAEVDECSVRKWLAWKHDPEDSSANVLKKLTALKWAPGLLPSEEALQRRRVLAKHKLS
jgi:hypothetical protein